MNSNVLILGARSDIGRSLARRYAEAGCTVVLGARRSAELVDDVSDLRIRHRVEASHVEFDVLDSDADGFFDRLGTLPDTVIMVAGLLGDQEASAADTREADRVMRTNYNGPAIFLLAAGRRMAARGSGTIVGISSVAGDRGRQSNFIYGAAKAGLTAFLSGLRASLAPRGVHVMTVKPGFVATQMTKDMKLPPLLTASADEVARAVFTAATKRRNSIYVRPIWWPIMAIIRHVPEPIFKKMKF